MLPTYICTYVYVYSHEMEDTDSINVAARISDNAENVTLLIKR